MLMNVKVVFNKFLKISLKFQFSGFFSDFESLELKSVFDEAIGTNSFMNWSNDETNRWIAKLGLSEKNTKILIKQELSGLNFLGEALNIFNFLTPKL